MTRATTCIVAFTTFALIHRCFGGTLSQTTINFGTGWAVADSCSGGCDSAQSIVGTPIQVADTYRFGSSALTASSSGQAGYGVLHAASSASFSVTGQAMLSWANSINIVEDTMTISFAPWNGLPGLLYVTYTLDGKISSSGVGGGWSEVSVSGGSGVGGGYEVFFGDTAGTFGLPAIPFIYGQPFLLQTDLTTAAGAMSPDGNSIVTTGNGSGSADFSNTLILSGLNPTDLSGVTAAGATFTSASGTQYSFNGVVPEPSTFIQMFASLAAILALGWRLGLGAHSKIAPSLSATAPRRRSTAST